MKIWVDLQVMGLPSSNQIQNTAKEKQSIGQQREFYQVLFMIYISNNKYMKSLINSRTQ